MFVLLIHALGALISERSSTAGVSNSKSLDLDLKKKEKQQILCPKNWSLLSLPSNTRYWATTPGEESEIVELIRECKYNCRAGCH